MTDTAPITYSLREAAALICGTTESGDVIPGGEQWLAKRLRGEAKPSLKGYAYKRGREWRFTADQIRDTIKVLTPERVTLPEIPAGLSFTPTSRRRLASA